MVQTYIPCVAITLQAGRSPIMENLFQAKRLDQVGCREATTAIQQVS